MKAANEVLSEYLQAISPRPRLEIIQALGEGEACVCHLEAVLGYRQAYISQHLMGLRDAGVIAARRDGRYIYYSLTDSKLIEMLHLAIELQGISETDLASNKEIGKAPCPCPKCSDEAKMDETSADEAILLARQH